MLNRFINHDVMKVYINIWMINLLMIIQIASGQNIDSNMTELDTTYSLNTIMYDNTTRLHDLDDAIDCGNQFNASHDSLFRNNTEQNLFITTANSPIILPPPVLKDMVESIITYPIHGILYCNPKDLTFIYTPNITYTGTDQFEIIQCLPVLYDRNHTINNTRCIHDDCRVWNVLVHVEPVVMHSDDRSIPNDDSFNTTDINFLLGLASVFVTAIIVLGIYLTHRSCDRYKKEIKKNEVVQEGSRYEASMFGGDGEGDDIMIGQIIDTTQQSQQVRENIHDDDDYDEMYTITSALDTISTLTIEQQAQHHCPIDRDPAPPRLPPIVDVDDCNEVGSANTLMVDDSRAALPLNSNALEETNGMMQHPSTAIERVDDNSQKMSRLHQDYIKRMNHRLNVNRGLNDIVRYLANIESKLHVGQGQQPPTTCNESATDSQGTTTSIQPCDVNMQYRYTPPEATVISTSINQHNQNRQDNFGIDDTTVVMVDAILISDDYHDNDFIPYSNNSTGSSSHTLPAYSMNTTINTGDSPM